MTNAKAPKMEILLTAVLYGLTAAVLMMTLTLSSKNPVSPTVVKKILTSGLTVPESMDQVSGTALASVNQTASPPPRTQWQTPPVLLPDMVPFRGKKGDEVFDHFISDAAERYFMDPAVIKAVIMAESGFNPRAVSRVGARGLMQLMPRTASSLGVEDAFDPQANILGGTQYLKKLLQRFNGNLELALAAYNAGGRNVRKYKGIPPFKATHRYIAKIKVYYQHYREQTLDILG